MPAARGGGWFHTSGEGAGGRPQTMRASIEVAVMMTMAPRIRSIGFCVPNQSMMAIDQSAGLILADCERRDG